MADYEFRTIWLVAAPLAEVWTQIEVPEQWPEWWRGVEEVRLLEKGDESGVGSVRSYRMRSRLPYALSFDMRVVRVVRHELLEGEALGELQGRGIWRFEPDGDRTRVTYDWRVATTKRWMNLLAPLARPLFAWNHDVIMRWGGEGLGRRLGTTVLHGE
jgi:uncharacterized protein YndB with AHSA1/START domain